MRIAIYPIFNFTKNHFHKNGLRTDPAAKNTAKHHREQNYKNNKRKKANGKNEKILRPESDSEENKFTLQHIKHKEWCIINLYEINAPRIT